MRARPTYRGFLALVVCGALVAGCADREARVLFDGNYYPGKVRAERDDRRNFTASVGRVGRGIEGAHKAVVHEATRYCIESFGTSSIEWAGTREGEAGPAYSRSGDRLSASGRCVIWR